MGKEVVVPQRRGPCDTYELQHALRKVVSCSVATRSEDCRQVGTFSLAGVPCWRRRNTSWKGQQVLRRGREEGRPKAEGGQQREPA